MSNPAVEEYNRIDKMLTDDLNEIVRVRGTAPTASLCRLFMRTLFTSFEGRLYALKQFILSLEQSLALLSFPRGTAHVVLFTEEERAMLKEFTYKLTSAGEAEVANYYPRFADSYKFTMKILHRVMQLESKVDYGGHGWKAVVEIQKVRNRLTHPKSSADLVVAESELKLADAAADWFEDTLEAVLNRLYTESFYRARFAPVQAQPEASNGSSNPQEMGQEKGV
jgi:hypothetical protein